MVTWILEREVFSDGDQRLDAAVSDTGGKVLTWKDEWWQDSRWPKNQGESVVFHGSLANADRVARELPWSPGAYCSTERFACSTWWPSIAARLVANEYLVTTVTNLVQHGSPREFGSRVFVRPDSPLKPFSGRVLQRDRITLSALDHGYYYDDEQLAVVVTPVVEVGVEYRFVVAAGRVVTGSEYTPDGRSAGATVFPDHEAWEYVADVIGEIQAPDDVFVIDVCETPAGLRVLELNPFSGADLYNCERPAVVAAVHALVEPG